MTTMADTLQVDMIVNATARGFDTLSADLQKVAVAGGSVEAGAASGARGMGALAGAGSAAEAISAGKASVNLAIQMQQTELAFTTLIGSADGARQHLEALRDFAARTPFEFTGLV